jgi:hypothetical protein
MRALIPVAAIALTLLGGCDQRAAPRNEANQVEAEPDTVDIPQTVEKVAPGTTPMAERVAVIGLLNKRNGISRDLTMKPGQAFRVGDVIVRLRACETTAPWEVQPLTGAFVQVDVRNAQGQYGRIFSGWLYKETPSLNVVEHPVYDVWPKSCEMTYPAGPPAPAAPVTSSNLSSARKLGSAPASGDSAATPPAEAAPPPSAADNNAT